MHSWRKRIIFGGAVILQVLATMGVAAASGDSGQVCQVGSLVADDAVQVAERSLATTRPVEAETAEAGPAKAEIAEPEPFEAVPAEIEPVVVEQAETGPTDQELIDAASELSDDALDVSFDLLMVLSTIEFEAVEARIPELVKRLEVLIGVTEARPVGELALQAIAEAQAEVRSVELQATERVVVLADELMADSHAVAMGLTPSEVLSAMLIRESFQPGEVRDVLADRFGNLSPGATVSIDQDVHYVAVHLRQDGASCALTVTASEEPGQETIVVSIEESQQSYDFQIEVEVAGVQQTNIPVLALTGASSGDVAQLSLFLCGLGGVLLLVGRGLNSSSRTI